MDYIQELSIHLDREMYYAGELLQGHVYLETTENFKLKCKCVFMLYLYKCTYFVFWSNFQIQRVKPQLIFTVSLRNESEERHLTRLALLRLEFYRNEVNVFSFYVDLNFRKEMSTFTTNSL